MAVRSRRRNERLLGRLRAVLMALATLAGLWGMQFNPVWGAFALAVAVGVLAAISADLGIIAAVISLAIPVTASNPVLGIGFAVLGVVGVRYLGADGGRVFLLVAGAVAGVALGPAWVIVPLAGYLMGAGEGALAAAIACASVEIAAIAMGTSSGFGPAMFNGGTVPLVAFASAPETLFSTEWISTSFAGIGTDSVTRIAAAVSAITSPVALLGQPLAWALGAMVSALLVKEAHKKRRASLVVASAVAGVAVTAGGSYLVFAIASVPVPVSALLVSALSSAVLAGLVVLLFERVFPLERVVTKPKAKSDSSSMAMEDADVDELLRLVATAEEQLATRHTTQKVVMITDMKSFSKMTEEDGSILSAKAIQKHRDLLLPIVERHGGHGKSTGGDGLVAAFDTSESATVAAAEMQRALDQHNAGHPTEREMIVRIGVAAGEVVLDKSGRPFIGTALNLAARVMNLADGGQAFITKNVAESAGPSTETYDHGAFILKNIAEPVEVFEILWIEGQEPVPPLGASPVSR